MENADVGRDQQTESEPTMQESSTLGADIANLADGKDPVKMGWDRWLAYLDNPDIKQKAKEAGLLIMNGEDTPGKRWLMARFGIRRHEEKKGNLLDGTKWG